MFGLSRKLAGGRVRGGIVRVSNSKPSKGLRQTQVAIHGWESGPKNDGLGRKALWIVAKGMATATSLDKRAERLRKARVTTGGKA